MAEARPPAEICGYVFAVTADGNLLESDVRQNFAALSQRLEALERENNELRQRVEHAAALERLAQSTVIKAEELAREIEAQARQRADDLILEAETDLVERRRRQDREAAADAAAARAQAAQIRTALENSLRMLGQSLEAAGVTTAELLVSGDDHDPGVPPTPIRGGSEPPATSSPSGTSIADMMDEPLDLELFVAHPADESAGLWSDPVPVDDESGIGNTVFSLPEVALLDDPDDPEDAVFVSSPTFDAVVVDSAEAEDEEHSAPAPLAELERFGDEQALAVHAEAEGAAPQTHGDALESAASAQADAALESQPPAPAEGIPPSPATAEITPSPLQNRRAALAARLGGIRPPQPRSPQPPGSP